MKHIRIFFAFILFCNVLHAQNEATNWYFGDYAGLNFGTGAPVALTDGLLYTTEGSATISDYNGNLLFYTEGTRVWNRNHQIMPNGTGLKGHSSSTHSALIVPDPGNPNQYYVFTVAEGGSADGLQYNIVDLSLDGTFGDVSTKNIQLESVVTEKITAVMHTNGTDIWVITRKYGGNEFLSYLVTSTGLVTTPVVSAVGINHPILKYGVGSRGCMKVSPDGQFIALSSILDTELFRFNPNTGAVSDPIDLTPFFPINSSFFGSEYSYGIEFSPDSSKLYVGHQFRYSVSNVDSAIVQFDMSTYNETSIFASGTFITPYLDFQMGALQLAIDGKIYVTQFNEEYLGVIQNPNGQSVGASFVYNAAYLNGRRSRLGLPPFIQSFFLVGLSVDNFCLGDNTEFKVNTTGSILNIAWDFGDGATASVENPTHVYATPGLYSVSVTVTTTSGTKTETKDITIYETPTANTPVDYTVCSTTLNNTFDLSTKDVEVLGAQLAADNIISYYPTLLDAQNETNILPINYTSTLATETVYARIANINNLSCYAVSSFNLVVKQAPTLNAITDWIVCDTDTDGLFSFNLTTKDAEVLNTQDALVFGVSYFETQADADGNTNAIGPTYTNTTSPQQLFYRIENSSYTNCYETGSFSLEVITSVTANTPTDISVCDTDNDGFSLFDVTNQDAEILGGQSAANYTISYHETIQDADTRTNAINATNYTNILAYSQTLYARVENNGNIDCYNTTSFNVVVHDAPFTQTVTNWQVCDDNNDGFSSFTLTDKNSEVLGVQSTANFSVSYYIQLTDAENSQNAILGDFVNTVNPQTVYYRIENNANAMCSAVGAFNLQVYDVPVANIPTPFITCDLEETGIQIFDLSLKDVEILNGQDSNLYEINYFTTQIDAEANLNALSKQAYTNTLPQEIIYARIQNRNLEDCYATTGFQIIINALPQPSLEETYVICPDSPELVIDAGIFESWSWQNESGDEIGIFQNINITELGDYTLTVSNTQNGVTCEKTVPFEVVSSGAPEAFTTEIEGFSDTISLEVNATGIGQFEYSIDGENFQDSNRFKVFPGEYTVYVRDAFLCRTLSKEIVALGYQKFFTPNGDNTNEYWNIIGIKNEPSSQLYIYDRYGKLVAQISPQSLGWDGTFNRKDMPASDYWFKYVYGNGKVVNGHFALKR